MSEGLLGKALTVVGDVDVFTATAGRTTTANILMSHIGGVSATIRVYVRTGAKGDIDTIWPTTTMTASTNSRIEMTNIVMSAGEILTVESDAVTVAVRAMGFDEVAVV